MDWLILILIVLFLAGTIVAYNQLVKSKQLVEEALSGIDVQLKRRFDLIPTLVETVKGYAAHEKNVLETVTKMRAQTQDAAPDNLKEREYFEQKLTGSLSELLAVVENYPDLKANENFIKLQDELVRIEDEIQMARRYYNGTVRNLNILVQSFPINFLASLTGYKSMVFFELESLAERVPPGVDFAEKGKPTL